MACAEGQFPVRYINNVAGPRQIIVFQDEAIEGSSSCLAKMLLSYVFQVASHPRKSTVRNLLVGPEPIYKCSYYITPTKMAENKWVTGVN